MALDECPNCGADLPRNAKACPECGSDEKTGWSAEGHIGGLDLPDDQFDYDEFVSREFNETKNPKPRGIHWGWWVVAIVLVCLLILPLVWSLLKR